MRYLGGKSRIAKEIASIVAPKGVWWEPFCGGLGVSTELVKYGPGVISDTNEALIALYAAVASGWIPPSDVHPLDYASGKNLPNSDPRKAFYGFGCSFGGKWFGGYARGGLKADGTPRNHQDESARAVTRDVKSLAGCSFAHLSFFDIDPRTAPAPESIYCDPPYEGTTGYSSVGGFDHSRFWRYCQEWAARGARVFVSEYACSADSYDVLWEKSIRVSTGMAHQRGSAVERLFRIHAPSVARCA